MPAYIVARAMGLSTVSIDADPEAPAIALADRSFRIDTRDGSSAITAARECNIDGVVTMCTDFPVRTVAAVAEALNLPGIPRDTAAIVTNKYRMREAFLRHNAPSPKFHRATTLTEARLAVSECGLPAMFKPTESSGSRGVIKVDREDMVESSFEYAMNTAGPTAEVIVEEFVDGPEVSVETASLNGKHHVIAITDKITTGSPFWVELGHSQPSELPEVVTDAIVRCTVAGLQAVGISHSPAHVEIKVGPTGPKLIEIGARLGGDHIAAELVPRSTGVDMVRCAIEMALAIQPEIRATKSGAAAIRYLTAPPGRIQAIEGVEDALRMPGVVRIDLAKKPGDTIDDIRSSHDRVGYVICEADNRSRVNREVEAALNAVRFVVTKE